MTIPPGIEPMLEERTKKYNLEFHVLNCCKNTSVDLEELKMCISKGVRYINHLEEFYIPKLEKQKSQPVIFDIIEEIKFSRQDYVEKCIELDGIENETDIDKLKECLKQVCSFINDIESNLKELGFKLS